MVELQTLSAERELWVDDAPSRVIKPAYMDTVKRLGFSAVSVMLDSPKPGLDLKWKPAQVEKVGVLCDERDIELILCFWPSPKKHLLKRIRKEVPPLIAISGAKAQEIDTEFNWKAKYASGFTRVAGRTQLDLAGDYLVQVMDEIKCETGARKELTTFTSHTENGRSADVAPHMDVLCVQAYSVTPRGGRKIWPNHTYGPGGMQKHTLDRTALIPGTFRKRGGIKVTCGLAAWNQKFQGMKPERAMEVAYHAAVRYGCDRVRYWSSKWILGVQARNARYAGRFIRSLVAAEQQARAA